VEILQHPFLFVGLLDAIVGLETGTRNVTGIFSTVQATASDPGPLAEGFPPVSVRDALVKNIRAFTSRRFHRKSVILATEAESVTQRFEGGRGGKELSTCL
jgi:hypothetical protein